MMTLGVLVVAVLVSVVLDRQERRHRFHLSLEYEHLGWEMPHAKRRVPKSEAILNLVMGTGLFVFGGIAAYALWVVESIGMPMGGQYIAAAFLALGITLITVGVKGLRKNGLNRKNEA